MVECVNFIHGIRDRIFFLINNKLHRSADLNIRDVCSMLFQFSINRRRQYSTVTEYQTSIEVMSRTIENDVNSKTTTTITTRIMVNIKLFHIVSTLRNPDRISKKSGKVLSILTTLCMK